jgi:hypothetical protein
MDKVVDLGGRIMNIGRPKGYVAGLAQPSNPLITATPPKIAATPSETATLLLSNILPAGQLRGEEDRTVVSGFALLLVGVMSSDVWCCYPCVPYD